MKDLRPEMSHLCSLFEGYLLKILGILNLTRVSRTHTIDVCPYLDLLSIYGHTDQRSRIIGTSTTKDSLLAVKIRTYESLSDDCIHAFICLCNDAWNL